MILKNIMAQLGEATQPVSKIIKYSTTFKTLAVGLKKGVIWRDHKAAMPTKLLVVEGSVIYRQEEKVVELGKLDDMDIPVDIIHSLEATDDSLCILIQCS